MTLNMPNGDIVSVATPSEVKGMKVIEFSFDGVPVVFEYDGKKFYSSYRGNKSIVKDTPLDIEFTGMQSYFNTFVKQEDLKKMEVIENAVFPDPEDPKYSIVKAVKFRDVYGNVYDSNGLKV